MDGQPYPPEYPPIAEHGLVGDLQTAALVTTGGVIDWYCCPRFDGPSVFAALLDSERGGSFRIAPDDPEVVCRQLYVPDTAILMTRFLSPAGVGEVLDFMPVSDPETATGRHRIVRVVRVVRGQMHFTVDCRPRFDFGRSEHTASVGGGGAVFTAGDTRLVMHTGFPLRADGPDVRGEATLSAGEIRGVVLDSGGGGPAQRLDPAEVADLLAGTAAFWRDWVATSTYRGRWREQVTRSAITLKLLSYAPTGGLVAAATAGLPEQVGGERNWDYRYTWVRDSALSVQALLGLGYVQEARAFTSWLTDRIVERAGSADGPLQIMYRVDGSAELTEETLPELDGYRGSRPVRLGNGAADQRQLDIYGEALDCLWKAALAGDRLSTRAWAALSGVLDWLAASWDSPEAGIWETRGGDQDFTYGRLMCWVAFDRGLRLAALHGVPADTAAWTRARDAIYAQIHERGWNAERQAFVQHYRTSVLDAALLVLPAVGFLAADDPLWRSTLAAMQSELVSDSLVYRYDPAASPDGLAGAEGTFSICTFWYVEALTRSGEVELARITLEKMFTYANHLGLYAEEIGLSGEQLGNFPQAFTHLALINAALSLDRALDRLTDRDEAAVQTRIAAAAAHATRQPPLPGAAPSAAGGDGRG